VIVTFEVTQPCRRTRSIREAGGDHKVHDTKDRQYTKICWRQIGRENGQQEKTEETVQNLPQAINERIFDQVVE